MKKKNLLLALLALSLVGCGTGSGNPSSENSNEETSISSEGGSSGVNSEGSVDGENLKDTTKVMIHYARNDGNYANWGVWAWRSKPTGTHGEIHYFDQSDNGIYGNYTILDLVNDERYEGATRIGVLAKTHAKSMPSDEWDGAGKNDIPGDRFFEIPAQTPEGILHIYLYEGVEDIMYSLDEALKDKLTSSRFVNRRQIEAGVVLSAQVPEVTREMFHVYVDGVEINDYEFKYENKKCYVTLGQDFDIKKSYKVGVDFPESNPSVETDIAIFYDDDDFKKEYTYYGDDLGVTFNNAKDKTIFKLWAPISSSVKLNIYDSGTPGDYTEQLAQLGLSEIYETQDVPSKTFEMKKGQQGVWELALPGYMHGKYYTYSVTNGNMTYEVVDPYARTCGVDGIRGQIVDFDVIDEEVNWGEYSRPDNLERATDASIYEVHVRDVTISNTSGVTEKNRGRFLGLSEHGTTYTKNGVEVKTGIDNIKELGVTHVQLQPIYDYASIDEAAQMVHDYTENKSEEILYNWGYDPENYNCLEGSYSTNPFDGLTRLKEFKIMMQEFNRQGIQVNMDVVYNHTAGAANSNFEYIIPGYYHRMTDDGSFSNGSGCGNEMASERFMYRKFVVDSCKYWMSEFDISGFRFDLMYLVDTITLSQVYEECAEIYDNVLVYGEPWKSMGDTLMTYTPSDEGNIQSIPGVGAFNRFMRDAIHGGSWDGHPNKGWVSGDTSKERVNNLIPGIYGQFNSNLNNPLKTINYVTCHDNMTLYDQLHVADKGASFQTTKNRATQAQAMVFFSQGISYIHGGEEFLRTKDIANKDLSGLTQDQIDLYTENNVKSIHNSYNGGDLINEFDYSYKVDNLDVFNTMRDQVALRNEFGGFRLGSYNEIVNALKVNSQGAAIDYQITYNGETYRVVSNAGGSYSVTGLSGYTSVYSNIGGKSLNGSSYSIATNEIVVFKK